MNIKRFLAVIWELFLYKMEEIPFGRYAISASVGIVMLIMCLWGRGWFDMIIIDPIMPWQIFPKITIDWSSLPSAFSILVTSLIIGGSVWLSVLVNGILDTDTAIR
jgi:hypothetical protein